MKAYTYIEKGRFELKDKPEPKILDSKDAGFASTAMSTTASPRTAAGRSAAESTEVRQNSSASRMPTRGSTIPMLMLYLKEVFNK